MAEKKFPNNQLYDWHICSVDDCLSDEDKEMLSPTEKEELIKFLINEAKKRYKQQCNTTIEELLKTYKESWFAENKRTPGKIISNIKSSCDKNEVIESSYMDCETFSQVMVDDDFVDYAASKKKIVMVRKIKMNNQNNNTLNYKYSITLIDKNNPQLPENFAITRKTSLHTYSHGNRGYKQQLLDEVFSDYITKEKIKTYFTIDEIDGFISKCSNSNVNEILSKIEQLKLDSDEEIFIYPYNEAERRIDIGRPTGFTVKKNARNVANLISKILAKDNENQEHNIKDKHGIYFFGASYGNYLNIMTNRYLSNIHKKEKYDTNKTTLDNRKSEIHIDSLGGTGSSKNGLLDWARNFFINKTVVFSQDETVDALTKLGNEGNRITYAKRKLNGFFHSHVGMKRIVNRANTGIKVQNNNIKIGFSNMIDKNFNEINDEYNSSIKKDKVKEYGIKDNGCCFNLNNNGSIFFGKQLLDKKNSQTLNGIFVFSDKQRAFVGDFIKDGDFIIPLKGKLKNGDIEDTFDMKMENGSNELKGKITFNNGTTFEGSFSDGRFNKSTGEYTFKKMEGYFNLSKENIAITVEKKQIDHWEENRPFSRELHSGTITLKNNVSDNNNKFEGTFKFDPSNDNKIEFMCGTLTLDNKKERYGIAVGGDKIEKIETYAKDNKQQNIVCANISDELLLCCSGDNKDKEYFIFSFNKDSREFEKQIITKEQYVAIKKHIEMMKMNNLYSNKYYNKINENIQEINDLYKKENYITKQETQEFIDNKIKETENYFNCLETDLFPVITDEKQKLIQKLKEVIKQESISNEKIFIKLQQQIGIDILGIDILSSEEKINKFKEDLRHKIDYELRMKKYIQSVERTINKIKQSDIGNIFLLKQKEQEKLKNQNDKGNSYHNNTNSQVDINKKYDEIKHLELEQTILLNQSSQIEKDVEEASKIYNNSKASTQEDKEVFEKFKTETVLHLKCIKKIIKEIDKKIEEKDNLELSEEINVNDIMEKYKKEYDNKNQKEERKLETIIKKNNNIDKISLGSAKPSSISLHLNKINKKTKTTIQEIKLKNILKNINNNNTDKASINKSSEFKRALRLFIDDEKLPDEIDKIDIKSEEAKELEKINRDMDEIISLKSEKIIDNSARRDHNIIIAPNNIYNIKIPSK